MDNAQYEDGHIGDHGPRHGRDLGHSHYDLHLVLLNLHLGLLALHLALLHLHHLLTHLHLVPTDQHLALHH